MFEVDTLGEEGESSSLPIVPILSGVCVVGGGAAGPADGQEEAGVGVGLGFAGDAVVVDGIFIEGDAETGAVRDFREAVGDGDRLGDAIGLVELMAIDGGPAGVFEDGPEMEAEGGGDAGTDDLEEEGFVEGLALEGFPLDFGGSAGEDESVAHFLAEGDFHGGFAEMGGGVHGNGHIQTPAELFVTGDVVVREGAFVHGDVGELLQLLEEAEGVGGIDTEPVEIHVDFEVGGESRTELAGVFDEVPPGAALGFEGGIAVAHGEAAFADPVFGGEVDVPPGDVAAVAVLLAEHLVEGDVEDLGGGVHEGDLEAGTEGVVPHGLGGVPTDDFGDGLIGDGFGAPSVVDHGLSETDDAGIEMDLADLEEGPVGDFPDHIPGGDRTEWEFDPDSLN